MKKRILIACTMQMDAVNYILKKHRLNMKVIWVDRKLHSSPDRLHQKLQGLIDEYQQAEEILLTYGLCGNAVLGLCSRNARLILNKADDCICQLRSLRSPQKGCYYLTREWTVDQEAIVQQCEAVYQMYGNETGSGILHEMYGEYHTLVILDTPAYDADKIRGYVDKASEYTGMCVKTEKGNLDILANLLLGNYGSGHIILQAGKKVLREMFYKSDGAVTIRNKHTR